MGALRTRGGEEVSRICTDESCWLPPWRDGEDDTKCLGHQTILDPTVPAELAEVLDSVEAEFTDVSLDEDGTVSCIECGRKSPASIAFFDCSMAGETLCVDCADRLQKATIRLDTEGYNY